MCPSLTGKASGNATAEACSAITSAASILSQKGHAMALR
jgi:hypothetical protein